MARIDEIKARLVDLTQRKADELKSKKPSKVYIDDLELSIAFAQQELIAIAKPLDIINGVR